ncbi:MAG: hypothetical protein ABIE36_03045 [Candidatus Diapherotrites archaeon]
MKKEIIGVLTLIFLISFVLALELPPEPMAFYGKVTYSNGTAIPNGYYITAKIGTAVSGQCEIINGEYGKGKNTCVVIKTSSSASIVEFFLGNIKLGEHTFQSKEIVNFDFITDSLPANFIPLSNGICEPLKGECSYNLIDCDASKTNVCAGNGRCDVEIGETCTFTPQDCGVCSFCGDGICNNGEICSTCAGDCGACPVPTPPSSGGGGGGGGGGSSSKKTTTNSTTETITSTSSDSSELNIEIEDEEANNQDTINNRGITGKTIEGITNFAKSGYGIALGAFIVLLIVSIIISSRRKAKKNKNIKKKGK